MFEKTIEHMFLYQKNFRLFRASLQVQISFGLEPGTGLWDSSRILACGTRAGFWLVGIEPGSGLYFRVQD